MILFHRLALHSSYLLRFQHTNITTIIICQDNKIHGKGKRMKIQVCRLSNSSIQHLGDLLSVLCSSSRFGFCLHNHTRVSVAYVSDSHICKMMKCYCKLILWGISAAAAIEECCWQLISFSYGDRFCLIWLLILIFVF